MLTLTLSVRFAYDSWKEGASVLTHTGMLISVGRTAFDCS